MTVSTYLFLSVITAVLVPVLGTTLYYLGFWAQITDWLWSRYPNWLSKFMHCAACSGTWYCFVVGVCLWAIGFPFMGLPGRLAPPFEIPGFWLVKYGTLPAMAFWGTYWVPILANKHLAALQAIGEMPTNETPEEAPVAQEQPAVVVEQPIVAVEQPTVVVEPKTPEVQQEVTPDRRAKYKDVMAKARAAKLAKKAAKGTSHGR